MELHIVPDGDKGNHSLSEDCHCCPVPRYFDGCTIWVHFPYDGREFIEDMFDILSDTMNFGGWLMRVVE